MEFDFPAGKFHCDVSEGFRWKQPGGRRTYFLQMLPNTQIED